MSNSLSNGSGHSMPAPVHYAFKYLINPTMGTILRSPAHGLVSDHLLLLTFHGRKSGRAYTTPVGYTQEDETLHLMTESPWWKNLMGGAPVEVLLRGERRKGTATPQSDPATVAGVLQHELEEHGPGYLRRRYRIALNTNNPSPEQLREAAEGTVLITISLNSI
ncbi:MAG: nitroreductase/quinone reductase family protein [Candidatus Promineifilaceae bacterium]|nr:nitroreductase/quinone reductase family protein [Candidatus Promineifilaceae bacterium]